MSQCSLCNHPLRLSRPSRDSMDGVAICENCSAVHVLDAEPSAPQCTPVLYNAMKPEQEERLNTQLPWTPAQPLKRAYSFN